MRNTLRKLNIFAQIRRDLEDVDNKTLFKNIIQNFFYGIVQGIVPTVISLQIAPLVAIGYFLNYSYVSLIINRPPYQTWTGRRIVFPVFASMGGITGYLLITKLLV